MATRRLGLTRDQLAKFLIEHEQIRQFELLFTSVDYLQTEGIDSVTLDAGEALAGVNKLAGVVAKLADDGAVDASTALSIAQAVERALNAVTQLALIGATAPPKICCPDDLALIGATDPPETPPSDDLALIGATDPPNTPPSDDLALIGATIPPLVPKRRTVGAWHDMTRQQMPAPFIPMRMQCDTIDIERGIWRDAASLDAFYVADAGIYNVEFSAQIDRNKGTDSELWIWLVINGAPVAESASVIRVKGNNGETVAAWNWLVELRPGASVEIYWTSDDVDTYLETFPAAGGIPAIPSAIITITQEA